MILIAHRGNTNGPSPHENRPDHIEQAMTAGFNVEIDVWYVKGGWFLGHDSAEYEIEESFLENPKLWCHAKNLSALERMLANGNIHCFWHQEDDVQLTSRGYIWTYPDRPYGSKSICVLPTDPSSIEGVAGICLDDFSALDINGDS